MSLSGLLEQPTTEEERFLQSLPTLDEIRQNKAERFMRQFFKQSWHVVEPGVRYVPNWHIDVMCAHLMAVLNRQILDLVINIPPRQTKSLAVSVLFPAFAWIHPDPYSEDGRTMAWMKFLFSSYSDQLATRDSVKTRRLIQSRWYQERWADRFSLVDDQNQKTRFENDRGGYRLCTTVSGSNTGEGGDVICTDDPNNVKKVESDAERNSTNSWWSEVMPTRRNDPKTSARIVIQQRSHDQDVSGYIKDNMPDFVHLVLPMEYDRKVMVETGIGFKDPRVIEGELLNPERFDKKAVEQLKKEMGPYASAGQLQQTPHPRGGGLFEIGKLKVVQEIPPGLKRIRAVRYFDKAGTEGGGAYSSGVKIAALMDSENEEAFVIMDVVRGQWSYAAREKVIQDTIQIDGQSVAAWTEQEPGSGGKESAERTVKKNAGFNVRLDKVGKGDGNKVARAQPLSAQIAIGNVYVLDRSWTREFIMELESAPVGKYKDQWDSASGAFNKLTGGVTELTWGRGKK